MRTQRYYFTTKMGMLILKFRTVFRCEEHLYKRLRWLVRRSVGPLVGPSVPNDARLRGKIIVTSRLIREEEEEEETDYVAIPLRRVLRT
jgi:hypothetical protein